MGASAVSLVINYKQKYLRKSYLQPTGKLKEYGKSKVSDIFTVLGKS